MNKVALAYSGGLDTSIILKWLQQERGLEVHTYTADLGQGDDPAAVREAAMRLGASGCTIEDLRETFVADYVFPMLRANAIYEGEYLLGTAIARPLIARRLVEVAREVGAGAIAHGATGKGNDQVRFELGAWALDPQVQVIAPWREWTLDSRAALLDYAERHGIKVERRPDGSAPYSMDANLLHISYEGGPLEDPWTPPPADMWRMTTAPARAPDAPRELALTFERGDPVALDGQPLSPAALLDALNRIAGEHGIGRADIVENRYVGLKSRGCYETPGGAVLHKARRALESITLDREAQHLKDDLMPRYARLVYNGYWWSEERRMLQALIDQGRDAVCGEVRLQLYKGAAATLGRRAPRSLFDEKLASFESDAGAYNQRDAEGFIKLNALRLKMAARRQ